MHRLQNRQRNLLSVKQLVVFLLELKMQILQMLEMDLLAVLRSVFVFTLAIYATLILLLLLF